MRTGILSVILLAPATVFAQDMPLFTFATPGEGWTKTDAVLPLREATIIDRIAVSKDGGTAFTIDMKHPGVVLASQIRPDGRLMNPAPYAPLRVTEGYDNGGRNREKPLAKNSVVALALTLDSARRIYVATTQDLQVFDPTGRLSAVLPLPKPGEVQSIGWTGPKRNRLTLWYKDAAYTRTMKTSGIVAKQ